MRLIFVVSPRGRLIRIVVNSWMLLDEALSFLRANGYRPLYSVRVKR